MPAIQVGDVHMSHSVEAALGDRAVFDSIDFGLFLGGMREAVIMTTPSLDSPGPTITYVNKAFEVMTGYDRHDMIGETPRLLQGPGTSRIELDRMRDALSHGRTFEGETLNYRKDRSSFLLRWAVVPIYDDFGRVAAWMSLQNEVSRSDAGQLEQRALEVERELEAKLRHGPAGSAPGS